jgi:hypothetical protein
MVPLARRPSTTVLSPCEGLLPKYDQDLFVALEVFAAVATIVPTVMRVA